MIEAATDTVGEVRRLLRSRLEEIAGEVRNYPSPIARCDVQLGALIEERARLQAALRVLEAPADPPIGAY